MNKAISQIAIFLSLFIFACSGNDGLPGPRGATGATGPEGDPGEEAYVFEFENVSFTAPNYDVVLGYGNDFTALASDVALVYLLWGTEEIDGQPTDIWRPLSQTVFLDSGILLYNYDFTQYDVRLFLDAQFDLNTLTAIDTDDWIVRVVVVPGQFVGGKRTDMPSYQELEQYFNLITTKTSAHIIKRRSLE